MSADYLSGWKPQRVHLTTDYSFPITDMEPFQVYIHLSSSSGTNNADVTAVFDELGMNSKKIAITKEDGTTQLYAEIIKWDFSSDIGWEAWIAVRRDYTWESPEVDPDLYLYFDSSQADNTTYIFDRAAAGSENVFSEFAFKFHLVEELDDSSRLAEDSCNVTNLIGYNIDSGNAVDGLIYNAKDFNGSDEYIENSIAGATRTFPLIMIAAIKTTDNSNSMMAAAITDDSVENHSFGIGVKNGNAWMYMENQWYLKEINFGAVNDDSWHVLVGAMQSAVDIKLYVDGVYKGTTTFTGMQNTNVFSIGRLGKQTPAYYFDGSVGLVGLITSSYPNIFADRAVVENDSYRDNLYAYSIEIRPYDDLNFAIFGKTNDELNFAVDPKFMDEININLKGKTYDELNLAIQPKITDDLNVGILGWMHFTQNLRIILRSIATVNDDLLFNLEGKTYDELNIVSFGKTISDLGFLIRSILSSKRRLSLSDTLNLRSTSEYAYPREFVDIPLVYGDWTSSRVDCIPIDRDGYKQLISGYTIHSVVGVQVGGEPQSFGYTVKTRYKDEAGKPISLLIFDSPQYDNEVSVYCRGIVKESGELIENPADFIEHLFFQVQEYDSEVINEANLSRFRSDSYNNGIKIACKLSDSGRLLRNVLDAMVRDICASYRLSDGKQNFRYRWL